MALLELDRTSLESHLSGEGMAVIDFSAKWCAPCRTFAETFEAVSQEVADIDFYTVDVEASADLARVFDVRSVPHLVVLKQGVVIYSESGAISRSTLVSLLDQARTAEIPSQTEDQQR